MNFKDKLLRTGKVQEVEIALIRTPLLSPVSTTLERLQLAAQRKWGEQPEPALSGLSGSVQVAAAVPPEPGSKLLRRCISAPVIGVAAVLNSGDTLETCSLTFKTAFFPRTFPAVG